MPKRKTTTEPMTLTQADVETIRIALSYAAIERRSYAASVKSYSDEFHGHAMALVKRFESLNQKMFGEATYDQQDRIADDARDKVTIFNLAEQGYVTPAKD